MWLFLLLWRSHIRLGFNSKIAQTMTKSAKQVGSCSSFNSSIPCVSKFFQPKKQQSDAGNILPTTYTLRGATPTNTVGALASLNSNAAADVSPEATGTPQNPVTLLDDDDDLNDQEVAILDNETPSRSTTSTRTTTALPQNLVPKPPILEHQNPVVWPKQQCNLQLKPADAYEKECETQKNVCTSEKQQKELDSLEVVSVQEETKHVSVSSSNDEASSRAKLSNNVFAIFAFREESSLASIATCSCSSSSIRNQKSGFVEWTVPQTKRTTNVALSSKASSNKRARTALTMAATTESKEIPSNTSTDTGKNHKKPKNHPPAGKTDTDFVSMKSHSVEEQARITQKWHSLADASAPLEVRRFQVLVATRLHARCQEPSVRKAMEVLRDAFSSSSSSDGHDLENRMMGLNVDTLAKADPEEISKLMSNLQFYRVKAKHIVTAAQQIKSQFGGVVPEDEQSLLQIMGVGKMFGDLLAFVNTRKAHSQAVLFPSS
jgi:endonuclease III